uniref:Uncharacterized protein n=1 Tax=Anguilla anguilla TaxID=7936 RepID=A0A0E9QYF8_ANGAN
MLDITLKQGTVPCSVIGHAHPISFKTYKIGLHK